MPEIEDVRLDAVLEPRFNYHRHIEILKRFVERLTAIQQGDDTLSAGEYINTNIDEVRSAMASVLADDVERQIQIDHDFPIRFPALSFHPFEPAHTNDEYAVCAHDGDCAARRNALIHRL